MTDYLKAVTGAGKVVILSDNDRNSADFRFTQCDQLVHKLNRLFAWEPFFVNGFQNDRFEQTS